MPVNLFAKWILFMQRTENGICKQITATLTLMPVYNSNSYANIRSNAEQNKTENENEMNVK